MNNIKEDSINDVELVFTEHFGELRRRIFWTLFIFVVSVIMGFFVAETLIQYLKSAKPASDINWNTFSPWDAIGIYMKFAFIIGAVVTLPFALLQLWSFTKPALKPPEHRAALRYIPGAIILSLTGLSFAYFVIFPMAFYFTSNVTRRLNLTETYGISQYFSFMINIIVPITLLFQIPLVIMFLTKLRILNPKMLKKFRRVAYLVLIILATVITPPDFISDLLVIIPLISLYEVGVLLSRYTYRKQFTNYDVIT